MAREYSGIDMAVVRDYHQHWGPRIYTIAFYPIYRARLENVLKRMEGWRPQRIWHLRFRPHTEAVAYYSWLCSLPFMFLGVAAVIMAIYSGIFSQKGPSRI
jgi:hypothetical protein